jgi:hypothetical protein
MPQVQNPQTDRIPAAYGVRMRLVEKVVRRGFHRYVTLIRVMNIRSKDLILLTIFAGVCAESRKSSKPGARINEDHFAELRLTGKES